MVDRLAACAAGAVLIGYVGGCSSPFDPPSTFQRNAPSPLTQAIPPGTDLRADSAFRDEGGVPKGVGLEPTDSSTPDDYIRFALYHSPAVEAAYQRWLAAAERLPQVRSLPDPRLGFSFFLDEVETRTGAQQARIGISQSFPWPGVLAGREDAAALAARAAWRRFEAERLRVAERVVETLHELAYLDAAVRITGENLDLLESLEEVVRTRYRVGTGSHPELTRVQVELGQLEDRLTQLRAMRPAYAADLNAALARPIDAPVPALGVLPGRVVSGDGPSLVEMALASNPGLLALDERIAEERARWGVSRLEGLPEFTVGLDYIVTNDAMDSSIAESGDDPVLLNLGITLPIWRERYDAGTREALARRLAVSHDRADEANRLAASIQRAWFEHTDADRRVRLYEQSLIPKAEESLRSSLAGFRAGSTSFLDLLDTERTLLEFAVAAERARADRGQALARMNRLVGQPVPTRPADDRDEEATP
ncbi:MAG: TolC family protein [Phycisphaerales bacterium JB037]